MTEYLCLQIFKPPEYLCFRICNVDNAKVIDWIYICSKLILQYESTKHRTKTENKKNTT